jgi:hypothetical protein
MKRHLLLTILFLSTFVSADYLDVSLETKSNVAFDNYLFKDINKTEKLEKALSFDSLVLSGSFNEIIGFNYSKNSMTSPNKIDFKEIYIGSSKTKFLGYAKDKTTLQYGNRSHTTDTIKYTFYDLLTYEKSDISSIASETFTPGVIDSTDVNTTVTGDVTRTFKFERVAISTENLYEHIRENTIDGENYFYGVAVAQNFTPWLRMYGVIIASYEQQDYSKGSADYYKDINGTKVLASIFNIEQDDTRELIPENGRFKGFGYGYKLTAEAYWKDLSFFITSYYKKTKLKNYHSGIKYAVIDDDFEPIANLIAEPELNFLQKYTSFGVRYRF